MNTTPMPGLEGQTQKLVFQYFTWATFWLLLGTIYGLIAAAKLFWPDLLTYPIFSFGRIRPVHTNLVMYGWSSLALVGIALFVVARTSKAPPFKPACARIGLYLWNIALLLALVSLSLGWSRGPQEYREMLSPIAFLYGLGLIFVAITLIGTVANRRIKEIYVSNWYILGAVCWLSILFTIGFMPFYTKGLGNIVIQGYFMHTAVGLWFTPLVLGMTYYVLPRLIGKPIYSYALGALGFWTNVLFYTLIGAHHFIFSPVPWWLQTIAILFSVGMMVPVWAGSGNFFLTVKGSWSRVRKDYALIFLLVGIWGYALSSTQGTMEAFRSANIYWHFTNFTVGHSHLAMYGFVAFAIWGAIYGLLPRITGYAPPKTTIALHFWLSFVGGSVYVVSISIAGVLQGMSWVAGESFIESINAAAPMWLWRSVGGAMMVLSHFVFAYNLWLMRPREAKVDTQDIALPLTRGVA